MKRVYLFLFMLSQLAGRAQQAPAVAVPDPIYNEGLSHLNGVKSYDPGKSFQLFSTASASGNAQAMNALGNMFANGIGVTTDAGKAIAWYKKAALTGYAPAWYNLGRVYQDGSIVAQDFVEAAKYFQKGANAGDPNARNKLAYFYYKGLGVPQSYTNAFALYNELAQNGNINACYFLGLCYRNGYGVSADAGLAKEWLMKAAAANDGQAIHELTSEPLPENASVVTPDLQSKMNALETYQEQFGTSSANDMSGIYKGVAVYFDFSRQYVHEIVPLTLEITKMGNLYTGTWTEGDSLSAPIKGSFDNKMFSFDSSSKYTRHNYYSYRAAEPYRFDNAALNIQYYHDSVYLSGYVRFYSIIRKEPGQPMFISLSRTTAGTLIGQDVAGLNLSLSPNPTPDEMRASFTIKNQSKVQLQLFDMNGRPLQQSAPETLPAGSYTYSFFVQGLASGSYLVKINAGGTTQSKIFEKL
jgi:hypothetical protein